MYTCTNSQPIIWWGFTKTFSFNVNDCNSPSFFHRCVHVAPFATCLAAMPDNSYMSDCTSGVCATDSDSDLFCEMLVNLASECEVMGLSVGRWRDVITRCGKFLSGNSCLDCFFVFTWLLLKKGCTCLLSKIPVDRCAIAGILWLIEWLMIYFPWMHRKK